MMKTEGRGILLLTLVLMGGTLAHAADINYTGAVAGDWATGSNWSSGLYPTSGDYALLNTTANLSSTVPNNILGLRIGTAGTGVLTIGAGADLTATAASSADSHVGAGTGNSGTVNQSGGTSPINTLEIGRGGTGLYTLSGGDLVVTRERGGNSLSLGTDDTATVANGDGTLEISGGSFITRAGVQLGSVDGSGVGTFSVVGSAATQIGIGSSGSIDGSWTQRSNSVLSVRVDETTFGLSSIFIDEVGNDGGGDVTFEAGSLLDVGFTGAFTNGGTYTVMVWEGTIIEDELQFAPGVDTGIWSFNLDAGNKKLEVTAAGAPLVLPEFVHPGITHKLSDLDRMKHMVEAQIDPWYSSYQEMAAKSQSSYDYVVQGDESFTLLERDSPKTNYGAWNSDIRAAYYNAIRWYITGDTRHADKAVEIFNAWRNLTSVTSGGTDSLSGGVGYIMIEAAELIKSTYSGWSASEIAAFSAMLVYPGYSTTSEPSGDTTFYWMSYQGDAGRHGNQGLSGWRTVMAMGIFLDNEIMYDRALRHIKGLPHRSDDLAYPSGPRIRNYLNSSNDYYNDYNTSSGSAIEDYGFNGVMTHYIWENGQCQESSRDQQHTFFGIGLIGSMAEMAWNQGDDLYSHENDRLLLGLEYNMRYNVTNSFPDQVTPWEPTFASGEFFQRDDRTLRWFSKAISPTGRADYADKRPVFEMPVAHYLGRGFKTEAEVKWTLRARDQAIVESGYEVQGWSNDAIGWGGLTARRPDYCYGDPVSGFYLNGIPQYEMNVVPGTIEAENYDHFSIKGEGYTYHDLTATNTGGAYRMAEGVDVTTCSEGGFALTAMESGEWITYTIAVPSSRLYDISIRYAASAPGGKIRFSVGGTDITGEVDIPYGAPNSSGLTDWKDLSIASGVALAGGVHSLRISISGASSVFDLKQFTIESNTDVLSAHWKFDDGSGTTALDSSGFNQHGTITDGTWVPDQLGGSLEFNGSSSQVSIPAQVFDSISSEISIAMWIYGGDAQPKEDSIFNAVDADGDRVLNIHLPWSGSVVYWDAGFSGGYDRINKTASADQFKGQWNHWVFTKNAALGEMKIYHNGLLWHSGTGKTRTINGITAATIGTQIPAETYYEGIIGDLQVFNIALTGTEISDLYGDSGAELHIPVMDSGMVVSSGNLMTQFSGSLSEHYVFEGVESLTNTSWETVTNFPMLESSPLTIDVPSTNAAGFYRMRWVP